MVGVRGGPVGPFLTEVDTDRTVAWFAMDGRAGVARGLFPAQVAGQLALDLSAGVAHVPERDAAGLASLYRGYAAWYHATVRVPFTAASGSPRIDALIACVIDTQYGSAGTGGLTNGSYFDVVPGTPAGSPVAPTDAAIQAWVGRGGWVRLADVPIAVGDTQVNMTTLAWKAFRHADWNDLTFTPSSGWTFSTKRYMRTGAHISVELRATYSGSTITFGSDGNVGDVQIGSGFPAELCPLDNNVYDRFVRNGAAAGSWRIGTDAALHITDGYPTAQIAAGASLTFRAEYSRPLG